MFSEGYQVQQKPEGSQREQQSMDYDVHDEYTRQNGKAKNKVNSSYLK